jgi:hypothetical protein
VDGFLNSLLLFEFDVRFAPAQTSPASMRRPSCTSILAAAALFTPMVSSDEIFSFERLHTLFASGADAAQSSEAAVAFGQDDDITGSHPDAACECVNKRQELLRGQPS